MSNKILVTGAAGFIGFHLSKRLAGEGHKVIGLDNFNDYYDVQLKRDRAAMLDQVEGFEMIEGDITDGPMLQELFKRESPDIVINLAAQAGVRHSIDNPSVYVDSNVVGFLNVLEACRTYPVKHLLYASSSSVYGGNTKVPFSTEDSVDHPVSLYAATKKSNELMAHTYSHLYGIPTTGVRFFTVYGPWGRPDMAYFLFVKAILDGKPIKVFNHGKMERDFTYVDDIVEGLARLMVRIPEKADGVVPYKLYNIGNSSPVKLEKFITTIEEKLGMEAEKIYMEMQAGDVLRTYADVSDLEREIDYRPMTSLDEGIGAFVDWYRGYY